jgi:hypothetical protein
VGFVLRQAGLVASWPGGLAAWWATSLGVRTTGRDERSVLELAEERGVARHQGGSLDWVGGERLLLSRTIQGRTVGRCPGTEKGIASRSRRRGEADKDAAA